MAVKPIYKELAHRVRQLEKEAVNRKKAEEKLKQRHNALKAKNKELREVNASLRTMLKVSNVDKSELGDKVMSNIKELVAPYIEKLKRGNLDTKQMTYLRILQGNLNNIVSPFVHRLSSKYSVLTPTEIEDPSSKLEGIFDRKERCHFMIRSLTPQQATGNALAIAVQVAQFVKEGRTTREIGELLNSSRRTVESHRQSIRSKLGLKNMKANLGSHLSSM
jgi:ATP/maltotriose-dependent transcriptional regulator MalT